MTAHLLTLHGINKGCDEDTRGYSAPLVAGVRAFGEALDENFYLTHTECLWASESEALDADMFSEGVARVLEDYLSDIFTYAAHGTRIQNHVDAQIKAVPGLAVLVAHSLGSVIAVDLLMRYLTTGEIAAGRPRSEWPFASLILIGSPLGIDVPGLPHLGFTNRNRMAHTFPRAPRGFKIQNFADPQDVVVNAGAIGKTPNLAAMSGYQRLNMRQRPDVDTGGIIKSHVSYWHSPAVHAAVYAALEDGEVAG